MSEKDLQIGYQSGRLTVVEVITGKRRLREYKVACICGKTKILKGNHLRKVQSCGCLLSEKAKLKEQKMITYNGETKNMSQWAAILNISLSALSHRLNRSKMSIEKALSIGKRGKNKVGNATT